MSRSGWLELRGLGCGYGRKAVLEDVSFTLDAGELLCLLGPNGVGKTTLFKTILGLLPPLCGQLLLGGETANRWPRRRLAQWLAYVPQAHTPSFAFSVRDIVAMGRVAHLGPFSAPGRGDLDLAEKALDALGITHLASVKSTAISGGERQLVLIARALAQEARIVVMDEPTSNLDYGNQVKVLTHIRRLVIDHALSIILTTHDPNQALHFASRVLLIDREKHWTMGAPAAVITEGYLRRTYGVNAEIHDVRSRSGLASRFCIPTTRVEIPTTRIEGHSWAG